MLWATRKQVTCAAGVEVGAMSVEVSAVADEVFEAAGDDGAACELLLGAASCCCASSCMQQRRHAAPSTVGMLPGCTTQAGSCRASLLLSQTPHEKSRARAALQQLCCRHAQRRHAYAHAAVRVEKYTGQQCTCAAGVEMAAIGEEVSDVDGEVYEAAGDDGAACELLLEAGLLGCNSFCMQKR